MSSNNAIAAPGPTDEVLRNDLADLDFIFGDEFRQNPNLLVSLTRLNALCIILHGLADRLSNRLEKQLNPEELRRSRTNIDFHSVQPYLKLGQDLQQRFGIKYNDMSTRITNLLEDAQCGICWDWVLDPVTTDCDHKFCRTCMRNLLGFSKGPAPCPRCTVMVWMEGL
jgi:hypothetical protein